MVSTRDLLKILLIGLVVFYSISYLNATTAALAEHPLPVEFLGNALMVLGGALLTRLTASEQNQPEAGTPSVGAGPSPHHAVSSPLNLSGLGEDTKTIGSAPEML